MKKINLSQIYSDTEKNLKTISGLLNGFDSSSINLLYNSKKVLFLGGPQISRSLSPLMHNFSSFSNCNVDFSYLLYDLSKSSLNLEEVITEMNYDDAIVGANVTMPYKTKVFDYLNKIDMLDKSAIDVGAVNTLVKQNGFLTGYNTDVDGIFKPIKEQLSDLEINNIGRGYILGAGGAAMAGVVALYNLGIKRITVFNRSEITSLINHFKTDNFKDLHIDHIKYNTGDKIELTTTKSIFINTLPFGFKEGLPVTPIDFNVLDKVLPSIELFFDIVYDMGKGDTPIIKYLKQCGIKICDGKSMLVNQAVKGYKLWSKGENLEVDKINLLLKTNDGN